MSHLGMLVPVRSIGHSDLVRKRKSNDPRTEWEQVASEEGILVTDTIRLMRQGDAIERLAGTGPSVQSEVADRLRRCTTRCLEARSMMSQRLGA
jgi:hypothetical protein